MVHLLSEINLSTVFYIYALLAAAFIQTKQSEPLQMQIVVNNFGTMWKNGEGRRQKHGRCGRYET